jgi:hypothetical protein
VADAHNPRQNLTLIVSQGQHSSCKKHIFLTSVAGAAQPYKEAGAADARSVQHGSRFRDHWSAGSGRKWKGREGQEGGDSTKDADLGRLAGGAPRGVEQDWKGGCGRGR